MSNEEKILAILEEHTAMLREHTAILKEHTAILREQGQRLEAQGQRLEAQGQRLEAQGQLLEAQGQRLEAQGQRLEAQEGRMDRQEQRLDTICADIAEMQQTLTKVAVTQEAVVLPKIQLLFEGHVTLAEKMDTLASRERVEELESDFAVMKDAIKRIRVELADLERAQ